MRDRPHNGIDSKLIIGLNNCMNSRDNINPKTGRARVSSRGGARPGAGRPKGTHDRVTIQGLLAALEARAPRGQTYVDQLAEDYNQARSRNDGALVVKYHNLILNKVAATLNSVEVADVTDTVQARQEAFQEALSALNDISVKSRPGARRNNSTEVKP